MKKLYAFFVVIVFICYEGAAQAPISIPDNAGSGNCLDFDGVNDWVDCGDIDAGTFDGSNTTLTIEAWVNLSTNASTSKSIASKYNSQVGKTTMLFFTGLSDGILYFYVYGIPSGNRIFTGTPAGTLTYGVWTHVAATVNLTTQVFTVYVDGEAVSSPTNTTGTPPSTFNNTDFPFEIGSLVQTTGTRQHYDGQIDEVRLWNVVRTQAQIQDNMCKELVGNEAGLIGYWNMNEGTGNTVSDLTSNGFHGTRK